MRVAVASGGFGSLGPLATGSALAVAWNRAGAQVAVVPMADAGDGFVRAWADMHAVEVVPMAAADGTLAIEWARDGDTAVVGGAQAAGVGVSSEALGSALADVLHEHAPLEQLIVDLSLAGEANDAGAGLLAALGARSDSAMAHGPLALRMLQQVDLTPVRRWLGGTEVIGVVPREQEDQRLLGLRGISAATAAESGLEQALALDQALEHYAQLVDPEAVGHRAAGACGGSAFAILALGGTIRSGPHQLSLESGWPDTLGLADLVVTCVDRLEERDLTGVLAHLAEGCGMAGTPLVVVAGVHHLGARELRAMGIESAYSLGVRDATVAQLAELVAPIAGSWHW